MATLTNSQLRAKLLIAYPQMFTIASNKKDSVITNDPDLEDVVTENSIIEDFISDAKLEIDSTVWGDLYNKGVILLTCHALMVSKNEGTNSGVVKRNKTGSDAETEYMTPDASKFGLLSTTSYGREFERLRDSFYYGGLVV